MATNDELERRIAALEDAQSSAPDQLSNNVAVVAPDGTISANFSGTVNALGVNLPAGAVYPPNQPTSRNRVDWTDARGALTASVWGFQARSPFGGGSAPFYNGAVLQTEPANAGIAAYSKVGDPSVSEVDVFVSQPSGGTYGQTLLGGDGSSDWVQWRGGRATRMLIGTSVITTRTGPASYLVPLSAPWVNAHSLFVGWIAGGADFSLIPNFYAAFVADRSNGAVSLNSSIVQQLTIGYISFGT